MHIEYAKVPLEERRVKAMARLAEGADGDCDELIALLCSRMSVAGAESVTFNISGAGSNPAERSGLLRLRGGAGMRKRRRISYDPGSPTLTLV